MPMESTHMAPVHTKIRDLENFKNEKFIHTPTQGGNLQSLLLSFNPQKATLGIRTSKATWGQMWPHRENGYN
jgi:hypothetical protein